MAKQADFNKFLTNIEPSKSTVEYISSVQNNLREYLETHEDYKYIHVETFLSGSYAKHTSIRPVLNDKKRDVDIVVVTNYSSQDSSIDVLEELRDVLLESDKYKTATIQSHSVGIELQGINIDVVPVIADPDDNELYYIGDSDNGSWIKTDPKGHKTWSTEVNKNNNTEYKPLVKIFKWWRRTNCPDTEKYPKGITLEKIIADNLGDSSLSTEDFFISTIQNIISAYKEDYVDKGINPVISDPSDKIENNDLLAGYKTSDFKAFINKLSEHADILNTNGTENETWRQILGTEFPKDSTTASYSSLSKAITCEMCVQASHKQKPIWPIQRGGAAFILAKVVSPLGNTVEYQNNGQPLDKECSLIFKAVTGVKKPYRVMWQIVNTGNEAIKANCLRGNFEASDIGDDGKRESTSYSGSHSVQCFIIKRNVCVAKSKEFIVNIK